MLSVLDLESLIRSGEGYNVEFKRSIPSKIKEVTEEICAFANAAGGTLLLGVNDNNTVTGVRFDNKKRSVLQNSINEISPALHCDIYSIEIDSKQIVVIEVPSGERKPYVLSGAIYVRQGPNSQKLTTVEEMRDFFQQSDRIYFDEAPCIDFNFNTDIDRTWFKEFRLEAGISKAVGQEQIINNLKLLTSDNKAKNGSVLFFGKSPEQFVETAVIRCIKFDGTGKTHIVDDKVFGGPLIRQYQQAMQWLKEKLDIRYEIEGSGPRKEIWEIPETVFKEAIINSLSHRDYYDKGARITVELFNDRIEISNPGGLTSAISQAEFGTKSHSRNPLIFGLFVRIHMVEQVGSGIGRMKELMEQAGLSEPVFKTEGIFSTVFMRPEKGSVKDSGKSSEKIDSLLMDLRDQYREQLKSIREKFGGKFGGSSEKILLLILDNQNITTAEMAKTIKISTRAIEKQLAKLKSEEVIDRIGPDKGGYWRVNI